MPETTAVLTPAQLAEIRAILAEHLSEQQRVYIFGSRATGKVRQFSDLDLLIEGKPLDFTQLSKLKDAFSESDLPWFVDIVQRNDITPEFYNHIKSDLIALP